MPKFSANLSMLFTEVAFLERFERAAAAGFRAVEYLFPYEWDKAVLAEQLKRCRLSQVLFNLPAGDWAAGSAGSPASRAGRASSRTGWAGRSRTLRLWNARA